MNNSHGYTARLAALLAVVAIRSTSMPLLPFAKAAGSFSETWETAGLPGWTITGTGNGQDCSVGHSGCSLKLDAECCSTTSGAQRAVSIALDEVVLVRNWYNVDSSGSNTDSNFVVSFAPAGSLVAHVTGNQGGNKGLVVQSVTSTGEVLAASGWTRLDLYLDAATDTATVLAFDGGGTELVRKTISIPVTATSIASVQYDVVEWNQDGGIVRWDTMSIGPGQVPPTQPPPPVEPTASVSAPYNIVATPDYVLEPAKIDFDYDSTINACHSWETCPTASDYKVLIDGSEQNGDFTSSQLDGTEVAFGSILQPAHGETQTNHVTATFALEGPPGTRLIKAAVKTTVGTQTDVWRVRTVSVSVFSSDDLDNDKVPDGAEPYLCGSEAVREQINAIGSVGSCVGYTDYVPPLVGFSLEVPSDHTLGPDADNDGMPAYLRVFYTNVTYNTQDGLNLYPGRYVDYPIDRWEDDANLPLVSRICAPQVLPSVAVGPDADGDGFPTWVKVARHEACFDRRFPSDPVTYHNAVEVTTQTVDSNDADPNVPVQSQVTVSRPTSAVYAPDMDNDTIPAGVTVTWVDLTFDRRYPTAPPMQTERAVFQAIDANDNNRNVPVPWVEVDTDGDWIANGAEPVLCSAQNNANPLDGTCSSGNYAPPSWLQGVLRVVFDTI